MGSSLYLQTINIDAVGTHIYDKTHGKACLFIRPVHQVKATAMTPCCHVGLYRPKTNHVGILCSNVQKARA